MADVKWIKITTDVFDDEKILMIESLPSADSIIVIWFKLLAFAGKQNNDGVFLMSNRIAYTDEMLASIFRREVNTVRLALKTFEEYGMIEIVDNVITIPNWNKHQTLDAYEKKKERDRLYQQTRRAAQRALIAGNSLCENGLPSKEWEKVLKEFNHECAYCGKKGNLEQEHIVPIKKGGKYEIGNIIPACRHCNASKCDKDFERWYINSDVFDIERFNHIKNYMESSDKSSDKSSFVAVSEEDIEKDIDIELDDKKKNSANQPSKADIDAFFDSIWNLYPVKKGKGQVSDSKRKVLFKIGFDEMQRAIDRYLQELGKDASWRKPQNGSTFFNSGYVDYLDTNFVPDETRPQVVQPTYHKPSKAEELDDFYKMAAQFGEGG